ncbi:hypothetical protein QJS04_geneDACA021558 [Acorus gramineus]|uniref:Transmembrane protein n=1 Tax=Acorus gramineus TaxID=55184 RepID=A0AAV9B422_ACOGR|nr:hypothetical protein QJS04_geneDACA021558 [Acorus gramineus]
MSKVKDTNFSRFSFINILILFYFLSIFVSFKRILHPSCALLRTLEFEGKKFNLESDSASKCSHCGELELWRGARTWWFVSSGNSKDRIHVSCAKKLLVEYLEKMRENGGGCVRGGVVVERTDASVSTVSQIVQVQKRPKRWRRGAEVVNRVARFLMLFLSVLLGDPTFMLVTIYDEIFR